MSEQPDIYQIAADLKSHEKDIIENTRQLDANWVKYEKLAEAVRALEKADINISITADGHINTLKEILVEKINQLERQTDREMVRIAKEQSEKIAQLERHVGTLFANQADAQLKKSEEHGGLKTKISFLWALLIATVGSIITAVVASFKKG